MIFLIIVITIFIGFIIYQYASFKRIYYSHLAMHKLREMHFNATLYLSENVKENLTLDHAIRYQSFLTITDAALSLSDALKGGLISFNGLKIYYIYIAILSRKGGAIDAALKDNEIAQEYIKNVRDIVKTSTKAISFFYVRILIFAIKAFIYHVLIKMGFKKLKKELGEINSILEFYKLKTQESA